MFLQQLGRLNRHIQPRFAFHRDVEIDELLGDGRHGVFKAERVFSDGVAGEDDVELTFFVARGDEFLVGVVDGVVDVEVTAGLDGEVEADFFADGVNPGVEAGALVRFEKGGECGRGGWGGEEGKEEEEGE